MTYDDTDDFNEIPTEPDIGNETNIDGIEDIDKKDAEVRKRIDDLLEKKRLRELLDDSEDW